MMTIVPSRSRRSGRTGPASTCTPTHQKHLANLKEKNNSLFLLLLHSALHLVCIAFRKAKTPLLPSISPKNGRCEPLADLGVRYLGEFHAGDVVHVKGYLRKPKRIQRIQKFIQSNSRTHTHTHSCPNHAHNTWVDEQVGVGGWVGV